MKYEVWIVCDVDSLRSDVFIVKGGKDCMGVEKESFFRLLNNLIYVFTLKNRPFHLTLLFGTPDLQCAKAYISYGYLPIDLKCGTNTS